MLDRRVLPRILTVVLGALLLTSTANAGKYVGKPFPDFEARDAVSGEPISLKSLRGKVVLIDFWATWCGPCVHELPNVKKTYNRYKDQGFEIVSISLDSSEERFSRFVRARQMNWPQVMEGGGWSTRLAKKYGVHSIPAMYIIDHEGVCISDNARGSRLGTTIERALAKMPVGVVTKGPEGKPVTHARTRAAARQLAAAREKIVAVGKPLRTLDRRLVEAGETIESIERRMPAPSNPDWVRRRYERLHDELVAIRSEMYACGMLGMVVPPLPDNPGADLSIDSGRAILLAWEQLPRARETIRELGHELRELTRQLDALETRLRSLTTRLADAPESENVRRQCERLLAEAETLAARCRASQARQMERVEELLAKRTDADAARLQTELRALGNELSEGGDDPAHRAAVEQRFAVLCRELLALLEGA